MGTTAIFKIYKDGKFLLGSWVKFDGGVSQHSIFPYFLNNLTTDADKKSIYHIINDYLLDGKFRRLGIGSGVNKPFQSQMNDDCMAPVDVLFWDKPLSDAKLWKDYISGQFVYEIRFNKKEINIKINYNGAEKVFSMKRNFGTGSIIGTINEVVEWVEDIDYGLNDCNCGEDKTEIIK